MKYSAYIHSPDGIFKVCFEIARDSTSPTGYLSFSPTGRDSVAALERRQVFGKVIIRPRE